MEGEPHAKPVLAYIVSNDLVKISSQLPSNKNRSLLVHTLVKQYGMLSPGWSEYIDIDVLAPAAAEVKTLAMYHSNDYLEYVLNSKHEPEGTDELGATFGIEEDCPAFRGLPQYVRLIAGASITGAEALLKDNNISISIAWDGGRHHAQKSRASGFCYVADCVLAMLILKRHRIPSPDGLSPPRKARIMYLDLDLHFSDGVSQAFASPGPTTNSQILTLSIHHAAPGFFPVSPLSSLSHPSDDAFDPFTLSIPLARGASSATFSRIWPSVELVKDAFSPDFVVLQCGADGLAGDPYAIWNWSLGRSDGSLGWCVDRVCNQWGCKVLLTGGGGYNSPNVARAWSYLTSLALRKPLPLDSDIPDHPAFPAYAPSFTLDVPEGTALDQNTEEYLEEIDKTLKLVAKVLAKRNTT